jgi:hypothetical protein
MALGEMHREIRRLERAPAQARIDERELGPLRQGRGRPGEERRGEEAQERFDFSLLLRRHGFFLGPIIIGSE